MVVRVVTKKSVLVFTEYDLSDDFFLSKAGNAFDGGGKVVVRSVFRCSDGWHTNQVVHLILL